jgi:hypothetical protein
VQQQTGTAVCSKVTHFKRCLKQSWSTDNIGPWYATYVFCIIHCPWFGQDCMHKIWLAVLRILPLLLCGPPPPVLLECMQKLTGQHYPWRCILASTG